MKKEQKRKIRLIFEILRCLNDLVYGFIIPIVIGTIIANTGYVLAGCTSTAVIMYIFYEMNYNRHGDKLKGERN